MSSEFRLEAGLVDDGTWLRGIKLVVEGGRGLSMIVEVGCGLLMAA